MAKSIKRCESVVQQIHHLIVLIVPYLSQACQKLETDRGTVPSLCPECTGPPKENHQLESIWDGSKTGYQQTNPIGKKNYSLLCTWMSQEVRING